jgi:phosphoglycolate phosphatase-like HAD superfamily hydrolase
MKGDGMEHHFDPHREILALDFDGVIVDSIKECLLNGFNAYARFAGGTPVERYEDIDVNWLTAARRLRNFIRNGEDYVFIANALAIDEKIENQADFDAFLDRNRSRRSAFFDLMFQQRLDFSAQTPHLWATLNPLYTGMLNFLEDYPAKDNLFIITTKKVIFVEKILAAHQLKLTRANVKDTSGTGKRQLIERILQERGTSPVNFYFVDDQIDTLIKIQPAGVQLFLAAWGYNNEKQAKIAGDHAIPVLSLEMFYERFGDFSSPATTPPSQ